MVITHSNPAVSRGLVDARVVAALKARHRKALDPSYLAYLQNEQPDARGPFFDDDRGVTHRIDRFLPLIDNRSELEPPFVPSREFPRRDARVEYGVLTLIEEESPAARHLHGGDRLLPFAALQRGSSNLAERLLGDGDADLLCFHYGPKAGAEVVIWTAKDAEREYTRWSLALADNWTEPVRYTAFTVPVAKNFDAFLARLRSDPVLGG